jgi:hypothetical protein
MRRALVAVALGLAALTPATAGADESIDSGRWEGSELTPGETLVDDIGAISLAGSFTRSPHRPFDVEVRAARVADGPGCAVEGSGRFEPEPPTGPSDGFDFSETLSVPCNGTYLVEAVARTTENAPDPDGPGPLPSPAPPDSAILDRTVQVVVPPPDVTGVEAVEGGDRAVTVSWSPVAPRPEDHLGYAVERRSADGAVTEFFAGKDDTSLVDTAPPAAGGEATYSVFALRPGPTATSNVRSETPGSKVVDVSPAPAGTGGTGGGTGGTGGTGTGRPGSGAAGTGGRPAGTITVPRVGTPSRNFFPPLLAPPEDAGFDTELPFEDREPGDEEAILPDDLTVDERLPGRGLAVPVATALVLAVWGLHLRFLARASRPEHVADHIEILRL